MSAPYVVAYTRVSTKDQAEEGVSLDAQRQRIQSWAQAHGYELSACEVDAGLSGGRADNRPALQRALDATCKAKGVLIVYSLSRLARSTRDALDIAERLHKAGANLVSLSESIDTTTAMGRFFFTVLAALAALERDLISERTKMALEHKRGKGEFTGGEAPYGFWRSPGSGQIVTQPDEQRVITMIREMEKRYSKAGIARQLNYLHVPCRGSVWHPRTVGRILERSAK
jgi:DNA invertase Pin-like site-specific DNA recombinase